MQNIPDTRMPEDEPEKAEPRPQPKPLPAAKRESTIGSLLWAAGLALLIRMFLFEPFNIPSTSMVPQLLVGDFLFVSKFSYGYSAKSIGYGLFSFEGRVMAKAPPQRGDVAVFKLPTNPNVDYIKRVIGMPGDKIQMVNGRLYINNQRVERKFLGAEKYTDEKHATTFQKYEETLPGGYKHIIYEETDNGPLDNTGVFEVPPGRYFMMGDNRDNSQDSRVSGMVGYVPLENFVGRAERLFFSLDDDTAAWEIWRWPFAIRYGRLFQEIK